MNSDSNFEARLLALEKQVAVDKNKSSNDDEDTYDLWNNVFDTETPLAGLYIAILFNYLGNLMNCDFQKWMNNNLFFRHLIGIIAFFFLFTSLVKRKNIPIHLVIIKTIFVYFTFLIMTKTKWYFAIPLLCMLIVYQFLNTGEYTDEKEKAKVATYRVYISRAIKIFTVVGFLHYTYRQYIEHGTKFSFIQLMFGHGCRTT